ncbi:MAG: hypothetical protein IPM79_37780 [Polyangiaceae bacterium]|nr:hypothetical protein [Polyangiaceae bacterium]
MLLKVDLTNGDDPVAVGVAEKYDAMAIPFLVLVDSKLQKVARLAGVASPKELADALPRFTDPKQRAAISARHDYALPETGSVASTAPSLGSVA